MIVALLSALSAPFAVPIAIHINGKQIPLNTHMAAPGKMTARALTTTLTFTFDAANQAQTVSLSPPKDAELVFQLNANAEPCRFQNNRSVYFLAPKGQTFLGANAVRYQDLFLLPPQSVWINSSRFRVKFSKAKPTIRFARVPYRETVRLGYSSGFGESLEQVSAALQGSKLPELRAANSESLTRVKIVETLGRLLSNSALKEGLWREGLPSIFCVKAKDLTLVYVFNYGSRRQFRTIPFSSLGLSQDRSYTVFDQDFARLIHSASGGIGVGLDPESVRVFMIRTTDSPDLIGSARDPYFLLNHAVTRSWDAKKNVLKCAAEIRQGESETVFVCTAVNGLLYERPELVVDGRKVKPISANGFIGIELHGGSKSRVEWSVKFGSKRTAASPNSQKFTLNFDPSGAAVISRVSPDDAATACMVFRNDEFLGMMCDLAFWDFETVPGAAYSYRITPISFAGVPGSSASFVVDAPRAADIDLADVKPFDERPLGAGFVRDRSGALDSAPILLQGVPVRGIGVMCGSEIRWKLNRSYDRLKGSAAVEDRYQGEARFEILLDGRSIWKSAVLKAGGQAVFDVSVSDGLELCLRTQGPIGPVAWFSPRLLAKQHP